jgi:hypothetical protein
MELDLVAAMVSERNANAGRKRINGVDPLARVSRKDTRFPGGKATCWYCGRSAVWGGNGITDHLMCPGAREWRCWCSIGFDGPLATRRVMKAITDELYLLEGFDAQFRLLVEEAQSGGGDLQKRAERLRQDIDALAVKKRNVTAAIAAYGPNPIVQSMLSEIEAGEAKLKVERRDQEAMSQRKLNVPLSPTELRERFESQTDELSANSRAFNRLLRQLVSEFHVYLVRLCDGGHLLPRARIKLMLDGIAPDLEHVPGMGEFLTRELTIDLFDPPQREAIREQAVALSTAGMEQRQIAQNVKATQAAVSKALALDRQMRSQGLQSPYVLVTAPPEDYRKLRRHKNAKYRFEALDGYKQP